MAGDELDLERPPAEEREPKERSERSQRRDRARERERQGDVGKRLGTIFERLAQSVDGRGDEELAEMIREDKDAMVGGLVNLTSKAPAAAPVVLGVLAILEPLIAFGRIFRLLLRRSAERREYARQEWPPAEPEEFVAGQPVPGGWEPPEEAEAEPEEIPEEHVARPWDLSQ